MPFMTIASALCNLALFLLLNEMRGTKKQIALYCGLTWLCCSAAFLITNQMGVENVPASVVCYTIPSLAVLWAASKNRGFRAVFHFCIADMVNLLVSIVAGAVADMAAVPYINPLIYFIVMAGVLAFIYRRREAYMKIQRRMDKGWSILAVNAVLFYASLYVIMGYPCDISRRPEYFLVLLIQMLLAIMFIGVVLTLLSARQSNESLKEAVYVDALTQVGNRAAYVRDAESIAKALDEHMPFFCVFADINGLKRINDELGHKMGDAYIKAAAEVLRQTFYPRETIYRIGGDEFFVFARCRREESFSYFESALQKAIEETNRKNGLTLSMAVGAEKVERDGLLKIDDGELLQQKIIKADNRMYDSKNKMKEVCLDTEAL